ncbi:MAG: hypothetical protein ACE5H2_03560 [Terriglobia bacterium]
MRARRLHLQTSLLLLLLAAPTASAGTNYHALVIRSLEPLDHLLLEKFKVNGKDNLYRLARDAPLTKKQYQKLPKLPFTQVDSFRVAGGRLHVRTRIRTELLALPQNFKAWPKGSAALAAITAGSRLSGRLLHTRRSHSARLTDGMVVYLFAARPAEDTLAFCLAEAQNTQASWENFLQRFATSRHAAAARAVLANIYLARGQEALRRFQAALQEKQSGYSYLREARQWLERVRALQVETPDVVEARAALTRIETDIAERLRQARLLAEKAEFTAAQQTLQPLRHFRDEFPELAAELQAIRQLAAQHHVDQARQRLARHQFDAAVLELETAASYQPLDAIPALREEIERARVAYRRQQEIRAATDRAQQAVARNDYAAAFDLLTPLVLRYPDEQKLQEYFASLQRVYRTALLAEVVEREKLHTPIRGPADEDVILRLQDRFTRLSEFDSSTELAVWRDRLSGHLAEAYHQRATQMAEQGQSELSPLAFAYLQQAYHFALNKSEFSEFADWRKRLEDQLRIRVALNFRDLTPAAGGQYLLVELSAQISSAIQRSGLPHVRILEASRGREAPRPVLELIVELTRATVQNRAEDEAVASEYSAGLRQVPNPQWHQAKAAYDRAVESYEQVRARIAQNRRKKKYPKKEQQADNAALARAEASLTQARTALDAVPTLIEQEDVRPYEFTHRKLVRTATIRLVYRWVNVLTGVRELQQILETQEPAEDVEVTGVHAGDKHGHRNQPHKLPDAADLRGRALRKIQEQLAEQTITYLKSFIGRDFERAQQKASREEHQGAAEDYLRFLFNSPPDDPRRQQALQYLQRQFRLLALGEWLGVSRERY